MAEKQLHPGAKWLFRIRGFFSVLFLFIFFGIWIGTVIGAFLISNLGLDVLGGIFIVIVLAFILLIILVEVYARLSYRFWKYEFTNDQLRIERGIIWKRYSNIPYQRIQNVDITRGIIARMLGFSSVNIQTAGYSMPMNSRGFGAMSEGHLPAVAMNEAEQIREFVMKKITKRGQGL
jgi:membrane protein YdbS with pleckstrin-like domain